MNVKNMILKLKTNKKYKCRILSICLIILGALVFPKAFNFFDAYSVKVPGTCINLTTIETSQTSDNAIQGENKPYGYDKAINDRNVKAEIKYVYNNQSYTLNVAVPQNTYKNGDQIQVSANRTDPSLAYIDFGNKYLLYSGFVVFSFVLIGLMWNSFSF